MSRTMAVPKRKPVVRVEEEEPADTKKKNAASKPRVKSSSSTTKTKNSSSGQRYFSMYLPLQNEPNHKIAERIATDKLSILLACGIEQQSNCVVCSIIGQFFEHYQVPYKYQYDKSLGQYGHHLLVKTLLTDTVSQLASYLDQTLKTQYGDDKGSKRKQNNTSPLDNMVTIDGVDYVPMSLEFLWPLGKKEERKLKTFKHKQERVAYLQQWQTSQPPKLMWKRLTDQFTVGVRKTPLPHQQVFLNRFRDTDWSVRHDPFAVKWSMGSGKTKGLTYLTQEGVHTRVIVVCPNTMINYWRREFASLAQIHDSTIFEIIGFQAFAKQVSVNPEFCRGSIVIVDEAQYYRNMQANMRESMEGLLMARKLFLLSGTFFVNQISDVKYLIFFFGGVPFDQLKSEAKSSKKTKDDLENEEAGEDEDDEGERTNAIITPEELQQIMKNKVHVFDPRIHDPEMSRNAYPKVNKQTVEVEMEWFQTFQYILSLASKMQLGAWKVPVGSQRNSFDSLTRRISNCIPGETTSPKFKRVIADILKEGIYPQVVYSHYRELGVVGTGKDLKEQKPDLRTEVISGTVDADKRQSIIEQNNNKEVDVLFITDAGGLGIDLKGVITMRKLEPAVNEPISDQNDARVVRLDSHPPGSQVNLVTYVSTFPKSEPSQDEREELESAFQDLARHQLTKLPKDYDIVVELQKKIRELNNETVDQRLMRKMAMKSDLLSPYNQALTKASIVQYATQKPQKEIKEKAKSKPKPEAETEVKRRSEPEKQKKEKLETEEKPEKSNREQTPVANKRKEEKMTSKTKQQEAATSTKPKASTKLKPQPTQKEPEDEEDHEAQVITQRKTPVSRKAQVDKTEKQANKEERKVIKHRPQKPSNVAPADLELSDVEEDD